MTNDKAGQVFGVLGVEYRTESDHVLAWSDPSEVHKIRRAKRHPHEVYCDCPDFIFHCRKVGTKCKHLTRVLGDGVIIPFQVGTRCSCRNRP